MRPVALRVWQRSMCVIMCVPRQHKFEVVNNLACGNTAVATLYESDSMRAEAAQFEAIYQCLLVATWCGNAALERQTVVTCKFEG